MKSRYLRRAKTETTIPMSNFRLKENFPRLCASLACSSLFGNISHVSKDCAHGSLYRARVGSFSRPAHINPSAPTKMPANLAMLFSLHLIQWYVCNGIKKDR